FTDPTAPDIYTLSLHDALPIFRTSENGAESVVAVQNELLQVIADGEYYFTLSKNSPAIRISTKNILFIACGAFSKIREEKAKKADRKSTRLNSSHVKISYAVFC